jgi:uncharacterized protein YegP (UPF0339 family)
MKIVVKKAKKEWRYYMMGLNNEIRTHSEPYDSKWNAIRAAVDMGYDCQVDFIYVREGRKQRKVETGRRNGKVPPGSIFCVAGETLKKGVTCVVDLSIAGKPIARKAII